MRPFLDASVMLAAAGSRNGSSRLTTANGGQSDQNSVYCGIFSNSPPLRADWWATMPATVMFSAHAMLTSGVRPLRMDVTNSSHR